MSHDSIRPAEPARPFVPAFAPAEVNVPVSTFAATEAASAILRNDVISPPGMNDSPDGTGPQGIQRQAQVQVLVSAEAHIGHGRPLTPKSVTTSWPVSQHSFAMPHPSL